MFLTANGDDYVRDLLQCAAARGLLRHQLGDVRSVQALDRERSVFAVQGSGGDFIVRFPADEEHLAVLLREQAVQAHLRSRVALAIPDTEVVEPAAGSGLPCFAIHALVPGEPLETSTYRGMTDACRGRLIDDLATFLQQTHDVPIAEACRWLGIAECDPQRLADACGKPGWFSAASAAAMAPVLAPHLVPRYLEVLADTAERFEALPCLPELLVFGHGDLHGYNMAIVDDEVGPRLAGVFDLGCTGVLDVHEDLFRLNLIDEDLLQRTVARYRVVTGNRRRVDPDRVGVYYRAFLFYLMDEGVRDGRWDYVSHMRGMIERHLSD